MSTGRRAALVTGASTGIGRAVALALADVGFDIAINYSRSEADARETERLVAEQSAKAILIPCEVSDDVAVRGMVDQVEETFGRLDALVNNAGVTADVAPGDLEGLSTDDWDRVLGVNVRGTFQVTRAAAPLLRASKGSVVNTASIVGLRPGPQPIPYAVSKAGVISLTRVLALQLGPDVRVNAVAPGWMEGDWMMRMLEERYDELMARRARATPLRRNVRPEDVAEVVVNLLTANRFVTGEAVVVDGGYAATT